jgi:hypothetical protein
MGYKLGQGLGRYNQGLVDPIEARILPKGIALTFDLVQYIESIVYLLVKESRWIRYWN